MASVAPLDSLTSLATIVGLGLTAGGVAAAVAALYRWYARERIPAGIGLLLGVTTVAVTLNTTAVLGLVIQDGVGLLDFDAAVRNSVIFGVAALTSVAGVRFGDRLARSMSALTGAREFDEEVSRFVTTVGRVTPVTLPEQVEDIDGYDPVDDATKESLAGKTFLFPRRLTVAELRDRLATRLREDFDVGHVSVDLADDGTVEYLGVGSHAAGIGPTLPPGTAATAVRADPPFAASSGDVVQLWSRGEDPERIATGEVRSKVGDVVTILLDEQDALAVDPLETYRLVTLAVDPRADREFASLLRAADETFGVAVVGAGSPLVGAPVGSLDPTIVAVRAPGGSVEAIPARSYRLAAGDTLYAVARPEALRHLETATRGADPQTERSS